MVKSSKIALLLFLGYLFITSCTNEKDSAYSEIKKIEKELKESTEKINDSLALVLVDKYSVFAERYKDDPNTPQMLFKAGELCNALNMSDRALRIYQRIYKTYPNYVHTPESLFLCGFIYENQLNDLKSAELAYKEFLQKYPTHTLAKDAKAALEYLGKDPAELIKEFEKKNKETTK